MDSSRGKGAEERGRARSTGGAANGTDGSRANYGRDALGLVLLLLACFFGVAVVMAYVDPREQASGMTALVMALVDTLGIAAMFLSAGLGWIGFRLWIRGVDGKVGRDLFGVTVTTLTLAVLVGALSPELGGRVGSLGAVVSTQLTVFVGLIFGVMVVLLPAWFLWLRPLASGAELPGTSAPLAPRPSDSSGVSLAESEGLIPKVSARPPAARTSLPPQADAEHAQRGGSAAGPFAGPPPRRDAALDGAKLAPPKVLAPSPYPPDVRREGRVPQGARPLDSGPSPATPAAAHAEALPSARTAPPAASRAPEVDDERRHAQDHRDAAALRARTGDGAAGASAGAAELRPGVQPPVAHASAGERGAALDAAGRGAGLAASGAHAPAELTREPEAPDETFADALAREHAQSEPPTLAQPLDRTPPRPSWEQSELFEEPVDAYGTPLALVEQLRGSAEPRAEAPASEAQSAPLVEAFDDEVYEDTLRPLAPSPAPSPAFGGVAELSLAAHMSAAPGAPAVHAPEPARVVIEGRVESPAPGVAEVHALEVAPSTAPRSAAPDAGAPELERETAPSTREGLRGFIDLRVRADAVELEAPASAAPATSSEPGLASPERTTAPDAVHAPESLEAATERVELELQAPARPTVVVHSLFDDAPAEVPAQAPASEATPEPAPRSAEPAAVESAPLALSDVVLMPARRSKRKPKASSVEPAPEQDSAAALEPDGAPSGADRGLAEPARGAEGTTEDQAAAATDDARASTPPGPAPEKPAPQADAEVELAPARPRARSRVTVDEVVFKAGCLFVERQRVAVSMLQREFGLDFDAATAVLDQLQRVGLIGPYLGGQRRDILLNMDEWQELAGVE